MNRRIEDRDRDREVSEVRVRIKKANMFSCLEKRDEKNAEEKKYMKNENYIYICSHFHSYYSSTLRTRHLLDICCDL